MTTYHSSDWHLGHARILELSHRPFLNVEKMNREIIERCNDIVTERDRLVLHGDNVMGAYADNVQLLTQLRAGQIVMLPGNHDRWSLAYKGTATKREREALRIKELLGDRVKILVDQKPSSWEHKVAGYDVLLSHFPYTGDSTDSERHADLRPIDEGLPLIHGHVHEKWRENGRMLNVGVDVWDFAPVSEHAILCWMDALPAAATT